MNSNIDISNIKTSFFIKKHPSDAVRKKYKTKITEWTFYSKNEATISSNIKKIPCYSNHYSIVEEFEFLNVRQLNDRFIEKLDIRAEKKYVLFNYKNEKGIEFNNFLFHIV